MLQFVREVPFRIVVQGTLSSRRGFLFHVAAGFSKAVDPLSGMSVNLTSVDQWLEDARLQFATNPIDSSSENITEDLVRWVEAIKLFLSQNARTEGATLTSLRFREERGWSLFWSEAQFSGQLILSYSHYIESLPANGAFDLLKIQFSWLRAPHCQADCQHEGFKLLKAVSAFEARQLTEQLKKHAGMTLHSGTVLLAVRLEYLGEKYAVEFVAPQK